MNLCIYLSIFLINLSTYYSYNVNIRVVTICNNIKSSSALYSLSPIEDDGYTESHKINLLQKLLSVTPLRKTPGVLVLVRHGETAMNYNKTFTGWIDTDLSETGIKEIKHAANLIIERGIDIDVTYTSRLKRAIRSVWIMLIGLNMVYKPVYKSWRLNERMYGKLEGLSKVEMARTLGEELVQGFRRGLKDRPPPMEPDHPHWHGDEFKYADLEEAEKPLSESLEDTMKRTIPLWESRILPELKAGKNVMIVAHANSLRGIVKHVDGISAEDIPDVHIPNAIPLVYKFDRKMRPIQQSGAISPLSGAFLEKSGLLKAALEKEAKLSKNVPGLDATHLHNTSATQGGNTAVSTKLRPAVGTGFEEELLDLAVNQNPPNQLNAEAVDSSDEGIRNTLEDGDLSRSRDGGWFKVNTDTKFDMVLAGLTKLLEIRNLMDKDSTEISDDAEAVRTRSQVAHNEIVKSETRNRDTVAPMKERSVLSERSLDKQTNPPQYIVITRHGKTHYNRLGIFTGWEDAPLADQGREEARAAGRLLKLHGIQFEMVYTSWLSRAIETAWLILDELDMLWLPINKTWRLNERMYGSLTGMSKKMIAERHGKEQFRKWRRGYTNRPPPTSSFSAVYPGNDGRYINNYLDIRYSFTESLIRSISHRRLELHRKFPKTESLRDCMSRTIPYFTNKIYPEAIAQGKNVLISSSENAIRGLLMHLCNIPPDRIHEVEIPTGLPLVYNLEKKCIQLLDDGVKRPGGAMAMLDEYDFGSSPELLFRPCDVEAGDEEDKCYVYYGGEKVQLLYDPILRLPPDQHLSEVEVIDAFEGHPENAASDAASDVSKSSSITSSVTESIPLTMRQRQLLENLDS